MIAARNRAPAAAPALQRPVWEAPRNGLPAVSRSPGFVTLAALVVYLLFRFGMLQDFISYRFGFNSRYHYVCVPILLLASAFGGRIVPVLRSSLGVGMTAFTFWMCACIPTSTWRGDSFVVFKNYVLNDLMIFVVLGCVACVLSAQKVAVYAMAAVMPLFVLILVGTSSLSRSGERAMMDYGTYGNPNSIASHLLFISPFVVCFMLLSKGFGFRRVAGIAALFAGSVFFFRSGSRGGFLALLAVMAVVFLSLPVSKKVVAVLLLLVLVPASVVLVPKDVLLRYRTIFSDTSSLAMTAAESGMISSALDSSLQRKRLFKESVIITFHNPIFGVGPGQFEVYTANEAKASGLRASWLVTHNTYTQVSSEMGLVGFVLYMGVLLATGLNLGRIRKRLRGIPHMRPAYCIASCLLVSWLAYCVLSVFDHLAYYQYVPLLAGFAVGLKAAVEGELGNGGVPAAPAI
jgi:O-antigen ligase